MVFAICVIVIWGIYTFVMKKTLKENFRLYKSLLSLVIFSVIVSIGLGANYLASAIPKFNDGIGIHNFIANWIIGDEGWSYALFKKYFNFSQMISILLLAVYSGLKIVEDK